MTSLVTTSKSFCELCAPDAVDLTTVHWQHAFNTCPQFGGREILVVDHRQEGRPRPRTMQVTCGVTTVGDLVDFVTASDHHADGPSTTTVTSAPPPPPPQLATAGGIQLATRDRSTVLTRIGVHIGTRINVTAAAGGGAPPPEADQDAAFESAAVTSGSQSGTTRPVSDAGSVTCGDASGTSTPGAAAATPTRTPSVADEAGAAFDCADEELPDDTSSAAAATRVVADDDPLIAKDTVAQDVDDLADAAAAAAAAADDSHDAFATGGVPAVGGDGAESTATSFGPMVNAPSIRSMWADVADTPAGSLVPARIDELEALDRSIRDGPSPAHDGAPSGTESGPETPRSGGDSAKQGHDGGKRYHSGPSPSNDISLTTITGDVRTRTVCVHGIVHCAKRSTVRRAVDAFGVVLRARLRIQTPGMRFTYAHFEFASADSARRIVAASPLRIAGHMAIVDYAKAPIDVSNTDPNMDIRDALCVDPVTGLPCVGPAMPATGTWHILPSRFGLESRLSDRLVVDPCGADVRRATEHQIEHVKRTTVRLKNVANEATKCCAISGWQPHDVNFAYEAMRAWMDRAVLTMTSRDVRASDLVPAMKSARDAVSATQRWAAAASTKCSSSAGRHTMRLATLEVSAVLAALLIKSGMYAHAVQLAGGVVGFTPRSQFDVPASEKTFFVSLPPRRAHAELSAAEVNSVFTILAVVESVAGSEVFEVARNMCQIARELVAAAVPKYPDIEAYFATPAGSVAFETQHLRRLMMRERFLARILFPDAPTSDALLNLVLRGLRAKVTQ